MAHNGGRSQLNFWFMNTGEHAFINYLKVAQNFVCSDNVRGIIPSNHDSNGNLQSSYSGGHGVYTIVTYPSQATRPGNYVLKWDNGSAATTFNVTNVVTVSGSKTGANGRYVFTPNSTSSQFIVGPPGSPHATNYRICHEDDESDLDGGQVFQQGFKDRLAEANWGVYRFLDFQSANTSNLVRWADRKSVDYWSYAADDFKTAIYTGATSNSANAYTATLSGFSLTDKAQAIVQWNTDADDDTSDLTLNIQSTGVKAVRSPWGDQIHSSVKPKSGRVGCVTFDSALDCYLLHAGSFTDGGIHSGVPIEVMVDLCNEMGAHPWFHVPYLALDPLSDFTEELATYCQANLDSGLIPRFEPANEVWNSALGFYATRYGWAREVDRGYSNFDHPNWYGRVLSKMGQAVHGVYGGTVHTQTDYQVICGVQTFGGGHNGGDDARLESDRLVTETGDSTQMAKNWATHVACANYWNASHYNDATEDTAADDWNNAVGQAAKDAVVDAYLQDGSGSRYDALPALAIMYEEWFDFADGHGLKLCGYEGGYSPDYIGDALDNSFRAATKLSPLMEGYTTTNYENFLAAGGEFPSCYVFAGNAAWPVLDPDRFATVHPQYDAIVTFNDVTPATPEITAIAHHYRMRRA